MTGTELYKKCKHWMYEKTSSKIYDEYVVEIINKVLGDIYEDNNMCRMFFGLKPLSSIPQITSLSDDLGEITGSHTLGEGLGIMPEYQLYVVPLGIDANFEMDDDLSKKSIFDTEYYNAQVNHKKMVPQKVIDELESD